MEWALCGTGDVGLSVKLAGIRVLMGGEKKRQRDWIKGGGGILVRRWKAFFLEREKKKKPADVGGE